jgi:intracellular multiplication protein IcmK
MQPPVAISNPSPLPSTAPAAPPLALPPLPGPNTSEVAAVQDALLGVTPEQIRELRRMLDARQRASSELVNPPKPVTGSVSVSLSPGATPPVIRPYMGSTSSFVVVDSTGAPWPVENFRIANMDLFPVNRLDGPQGSAFTIDTTVPYGQSNLVLKLAGVPAPVVISLVAGQREHDARVEVRIQGRGPNSTVAAGSLMAGTDSRLLPVLDGIAPSGGKSLSVGGLEGVRAWLLPSGRLLVRSPVKIVSPASTTFVVSADGTHVYEFAQTTQLLGLVDGQFVQMTVNGW